MNAGSHEHIVRSFDKEMSRLTGEIAAMGHLAVAQLEAAMAALAGRDSAAARHVVDHDDALDAQERRISDDVVRLLALRQPMARDLREILAALRIASDIERIGDYAANVAKRSLTLNLSDPVPLVGGLAPMAGMAGRMVREAMQAYVAHDAAMAHAVRERDADLDALYTTLFRELLTYMMEDPRSISACTHLLFIAKNIERVGDHATNIAENVWFVVHGDLPGAPRPKQDHTLD
jgi:phosphate transport system protein